MLVPGPWWLVSQNQVRWLAAGKQLESPRTDWIEFRWACSRCLRSKRAIAANADKQSIGERLPIYAYFDTSLTCADCGGTFAFTASEQRYWYERLKFFVASRPAQCPPCRRKRRGRRRTENQLRAALASLNPKDAMQLLHVAALYRDLGHERQADQYFRRSRNSAKALGQTEAWRIASSGLDWD